MPADGAPGAWLAGEFASGIGRVLESMTGDAPTLEYASHEISPADLAAGEDALLWWEQPLSLASGSAVWVGANRPAWDGIGARVLHSAGIEEVDADNSRSTYMEIVTQTLSGIAAAVSARVGREISCGAGKENAPAPDANAPCYSFRIVFADAELSVLAAFHNSLADLAAAADPATTLPSEEPPSSAPKPAPAAHPPGPATSNSMDLLLDVELPVSISFGRAQLPLKDVIKLTTGSIVELNRSVSEPVEVIVNNCVIARGEVVVVEGNFGIRIKQVVSRQERLRTLN
ncbi:MAG TPA: flagellar motor switch protein FliN [Bryobacteraceae bacterium]|nr:flagellar motor switch protein FliN [Bryobacteraceae bacterium]